MGFIPIRKDFVRKLPDPVAVLLRVEERLIHGQLVQVSVYGPGSSGRVRYKTGPEIAQALRDAYEVERKDYHPQNELAYMGLPSSPAADKQPGGESSKKRSK